MFRGNWLFIAAVVGCIAIASPPWNNAQSYERKTDHQITKSLHDIVVTLQKANEPNKLNKPCRYNQQDRESQLCAQWVSADAGTTSALWAERTFWIGVGAGCIGLLAWAAAAAAAFFAHNAVKETRRIGEAQTRAYLSIVKVEGQKIDGGMTFTIYIQNAGQSPARDVLALVTVFTFNDGPLPLPSNRWGDTIPAISTKALPIVYFVNEDAKTWEGIAIKIAIGSFDVFGQFNKFEIHFLGSPQKWEMDKPTQLVSGHNVASFLDSGLEDNSRLWEAEGHQPSTANDGKRRQGR